MKKVLIPVYSFYPLNIGGTFRLVKFAKYLKEFGWEPIVVAPNWTDKNTRFFDSSMAGKDPCRVERVEWKQKRTRIEYYRRKIVYKLTSQTRYFPDNLAISLLEKCRQVCKTEKIDAIFASSEPQSIHWIAYRLYKEFGYPWIADFRDIVDQEKIDEPNPSKYLKKFILRQRSIYKDVIYTRSSSLITTVSDGLKVKLQQHSERPVHIIMNGFDPVDFQYYKATPNRKFTIVYSGSLYGIRKPTVFLQGVDLIISEFPEIRKNTDITFYGRSSDLIRDYFKDVRNSEIIIPGGHLTHEKSLEYICKADVLYLISHPSKGIVTGKIFEYIASGKKILSVPGDGDITDKIITETNSGAIANTPREVADIIKKWYLEWKQNGTIVNNQKKSEVFKYTRKSQTEELAILLDEVTVKRVSEKFA